MALLGWIAVFAVFNVGAMLITDSSWEKAAPYGLLGFIVCLLVFALIQGRDGPSHRGPS